MHRVQEIDSQNPGGDCPFAVDSLALRILQVGAHGIEPMSNNHRRSIRSRMPSPIHGNPQVHMRELLQASRLPYTVSGTTGARIVGEGPVPSRWHHVQILAETHRSSGVVPHKRAMVAAGASGWPLGGVMW